MDLQRKKTALNCARYKRLHPKDCADDEKAVFFLLWGPRSVFGWCWVKGLEKGGGHSERNSCCCCCCCCLIFWSNLIANLTQPEPPNGGLVREIPLISGKSRLVKYYDLTRILVFLFFERFVRVFPRHMHVMFMHHSCCAHVLFIRRLLRSGFFVLNFSGEPIHQNNKVGCDPCQFGISKGKGSSSNQLFSRTIC